MLEDFIIKIGKSPEAKERVCFRKIIWSLCVREVSGEIVVICLLTNSDLE